MKQQSKLSTSRLVLTAASLALASTTVARTQIPASHSNTEHQNIINELVWDASESDPDLKTASILHARKAPAPRKAAEEEKEIQQGDLYFLLDDNTMEAMVSGWSTDRWDPNWDVVIPATVTDDDKTYKVTSFWERLFTRTGIETFVVGENIRELPYQLFRNCQNLKSVTLNEGLTAIGAEAFNGCVSLTSIEFPASLESIGNYAFMESGLSGQVTLPVSLNTIGQNPFRSLTTVESFEVAEGNTSFTALDGAVYSYDMTRLQLYAAGAQATNLNIPEGVTVIAAEAARNNPYIQTVSLPSTLEEMGDFAFCSGGLQSIAIPASVTKIGRGAIFNCQALKDITVDAQNSVYTMKNGLLCDNAAATTLAVTAGEGSITVPDGITAIGDYTFYGHAYTSVNLPASVKSIGWAAFYNCLWLKSVAMEGVEYIGNMAFQNCSSLENFTFPDTLRTLEEQAFAFAGMSEVTIPEGVTTVLNLAFFNMPNLLKVTIPTSVTEWGEAVFGNNGTLVTAVIPEGVKLIPNTMFNWCWSLTDVKLPSTLERLGAYCFYGAAFEELELPDGLLAIEEAALYDTGLKSVKVPDSVIEMGEFALGWNGNLESVELGTGVKELPAFLMTVNFALTNVVIPEGVTSMGEECVSNTIIPSITLPSTLEYMGYHTLYADLMLRHIICKAEVPPTVDEELLEESMWYYDEENDCDVEVKSYEDITLSVPEGSVEAYKSHPVWGLFKNIKGDALTGISSVNAADATVKEIYNLDGSRVNSTENGVYIYRMSDGSYRKVMVK